MSAGKHPRQFSKEATELENKRRVIQKTETTVHASSASHTFNDDPPPPAAPQRDEEDYNSLMKESLEELSKKQDDKKHEPQVPSSGSLPAASASASASAPQSGLLIKNKKIELVKEQLDALAAIRSGENVLLIGAAGTGKSSLLNTFFEEQKAAGKKIYATAMVSLAATNYEGGMTAHKYFGVYWCVETLEAIIKTASYEAVNYVRVAKRAQKARDELNELLRTKAPAVEIRLKDMDCNLLETEMRRMSVHRLVTADVVCIDEIGVARVTDYEKMMRRIQTVRKICGKPPVQIIHIGDPLQAKPVNKKPPDNATEQERLDYARNFGLLMDDDVWKKMGIKTITLKQVHRQSDAKQVDVLEHIRVGVITDEVAAFLEALSITSTVAEGRELLEQARAEAAELTYRPPIYLSALKKDVRQQNEKRLNELLTEELNYATHVYYVKRDPQTKTVWHNKVLIAQPDNDDDKKSELAQLDAFRFDYSDPVRDPIQAKDKQLFCDEHIQMGRLDQLKKNIVSQLSQLQIDPILRTKPDASVLITREVLKGKVINGTRATLTNAVGFKEFAAENTVNSLPHRRRATDHIRLKAGPPPDPDGPGTPVLWIKVDGIQTDVAITPVDYKFACDPAEAALPQEQWTSWYIIRGMPLLNGWAVTIHKSIGMTFQRMIFNAGSILRHGAPTGLFYLGLSRATDLKQVSLLGYDEAVIEARAAAIRYLHEDLVFFKDLDEEGLEDALEQGRTDRHLDENRRSLDPGFRLRLRSASASSSVDADADADDS